MPILYTTGDVAKLCGVSVRTVQYYDERHILMPSKTSEGGRRLYTEEDLKRMHVICFLREIGLSIKNISDIFKEDEPQKIISVLLDEQKKSIKSELFEAQRRLDIIESINREIKTVDNFSVESIGDIQQIMKEKNKLKKMRAIVLLSAIPMIIFQVAAIALWIANGIWWPFAVQCLISIPYAIILSTYYIKRVAYICPKCHEVFTPKFKEMFWAYHTPRMRRLTCPACKHRGLCVEIYADKKDTKKGQQYDNS